jgi:flavin reductase (DIM6/NTAB) family NADH-FMN oxidoreductase RutF
MTAPMTVPTIDDDLARTAFLAAFRQHAAGVAVVTVPGPGGPAGFTATSLASVSLDPPLLSFGISSGSSTWPALRDAGSVVVHVLSDGQRDVAELFARTGADRFGAGTRWRELPTGEPVLHGVAAWLRCRIEERFTAGSHRLVVAGVVEGAADPGARPLLYHAGGYGVLEPHPTYLNRRDS